MNTKTSEDCFDCGQNKAVFTKAYRRGGYKPVCEACAEKEPAFYYVYQDLGGTYGYWEGNKQQLEKHLANILEQHGKLGLSSREVFLVPGKYRYESDVTKRRHGQSVYVSATINGEVSIR